MQLVDQLIAIVIEENGNTSKCQPIISTMTSIELLDLDTAIEGFFRAYDKAEKDPNLSEEAWEEIHHNTFCISNLADIVFQEFAKREE